MRILTNNLKTVYKLWSLIRVRGVQLNEYVYLDFKAKKLGFYNSTSSVKVDLHLEDNDGNGLSHRNMFIDGSKFFSLVQFYDYIDLDEDDVFYSSTGDKFIIPELSDEPAIADQEYSDWKKMDVDFTPELNKKLSIASTYVDPDDKSGFSALFVHKGDLIACNRFRMLFAETDNGMNSSDFDLPIDLLKILISMNMQGSVRLLIRTTDTGAKMMEVSYGDIWLRYGSSSRFELPFDPDSEDFHSTYDHNNYFSVALSDVDEAVRFLSSFYNDIQNTVCNLVFNTEDPENMSLVFHLSYESGGTSDYRVKISSCSDPSYFEGKSAFMYLSFIRNAIGVLSQYEVEEVRITYEEDAPAMAFMDAKEEAPVFVIHTVVEEV